MFPLHRTPAMYFPGMSGGGLGGGGGGNTAGMSDQEAAMVKAVSHKSKAHPISFELTNLS